MTEQGNDGINSRAVELYLKSYEEFFSEPYHSPQHLIVNTRLENERYILFRFIDDRYGTDLNQDYFSGQFGIIGMTFSIEFKVYCYDKQIGDFVVTCYNDINNFFTEEETSKHYGLTAQNLQERLKQRGVVEYDHVLQVYKDIELPDEEWPGIGSVSTTQDAYGQMQYDRSKYRIPLKSFQKIEFNDTKDWLKQFTNRLDVLQIKHSVENENLIIDRYYRPV